jgi:hypothetical protein
MLLKYYISFIVFFSIGVRELHKGNDGIRFYNNTLFSGGVFGKAFITFRRVIKSSPSINLFGFLFNHI